MRSNEVLNWSALHQDEDRHCARPGGASDKHKQKGVHVLDEAVAQRHVCVSEQRSQNTDHGIQNSTARHGQSVKGADTACQLVDGNHQLCVTSYMPITHLRVWFSDIACDTIYRSPRAEKCLIPANGVVSRFTRAGLDIHVPETRGARERERGRRRAREP